ncbi:hypothetical protein [Dokdonella sp.]|uniref:hypothetical protein n=1 Tax=Dokdonella sp. TaxID=2291710 RepID=UPI002F408B95
MSKQRSLTLALVVAVALCGADGALARKPHHATVPTKESPAEAKPSQPVGRLVEYAELEQRVGSEVVVETTLHTVRRGTLTKWSNPALTLQLGPEHGGVELTIPRETIRNVSIVLAPAGGDAPAAEPAKPAATPEQKPGAGSAKKN